MDAELADLPKSKPVKLPPVDKPADKSVDNFMEDAREEETRVSQRDTVGSRREIPTYMRHLQNPWIKGHRRSVLRCVRAMIRLSGSAIGVSGEMPVFQSGIRTVQAVCGHGTSGDPAETVAKGSLSRRLVRRGA